MVPRREPAYWACVLLRAALSSCLVLGPTGCATSVGCAAHACLADAALTARVRTSLAQADDLGVPNEIRVQSSHGVVYLRGLVSTPYQIEQAGSIAAQARGVSVVVNLIAIDNAR